MHAPTLRLFAQAFAPAGFRLQSFTAAYGLAEHVVFVAAGAVGPSRLETTTSTLTLSQRALQRGEVVVVEEEETGSERGMARRTLELCSSGRPPPEVQVRLETRRLASG